MGILTEYVVLHNEVCCTVLNVSGLENWLETEVFI